jgi:MFS family permease
LLLNATTMTSALVFAVAYGVFFGSEVSLDQVVHAEYFGRRSMGVIRGSFQPAGLAMNAAGPFFAGFWYDQTGSYTGPFLLFSVLFLLASVSIAFAIYPRPADPGEEPAPA